MPEVYLAGTVSCMFLSAKTVEMLEHGACVGLRLGYGGFALKVKSRSRKAGFLLDSASTGTKADPVPLVSFILY